MTKPTSTPTLPILFETGGENPPSVENKVAPQIVGSNYAKKDLLADVPINVKRPSKLSRGRKRVEKNKKASEGKYLSPSFESYGVAYDMFTQTTLPKDQEALNMMPDIELKINGFLSLLK